MFSLQLPSSCGCIDELDQGRPRFTVEMGRGGIEGRPGRGKRKAENEVTRDGYRHTSLIDNPVSSSIASLYPCLHTVEGEVWSLCPGLVRFLSTHAVYRRSYRDGRKEGVTDDEVDDLGY